MGRTRFTMTVGLAIMFLRLSQVAAETPGDNISLEVESKIQSPGKQPGSIEVTYTLVNTSAKPITAYKFGCTHALQSSNGNFAYVGEDGYLPWERFQAGEVDETQRKGYILPRERISQTISLNLNERDGPFSGTTCEVVVVIYADTSVEGEASLAESFFQQRATTATDAKNAYRVLLEQLAHGKSLNDAIGKIASEQRRDALNENGANGAVDFISQLRETARGDQEHIANMALAQLRSDYQRAMKHLPAEWERIVLKRTEP